MEASLAAQLGLHAGKVRAPLPFVHPSLVFLHPAQQILDVAQRDFIQLGPHPHGGLLQDLGAVDLGRVDLGHGDLRHGDLCDGHTWLEAQIVLATEVYKPLMEAINSKDRNMWWKKRSSI